MIAFVRGVISERHGLRVDAPAVRLDVGEHRRAAAVERRRWRSRPRSARARSPRRRGRCPHRQRPGAARRCSSTSRSRAWRRRTRRTSSRAGRGSPTTSRSSRCGRRPARSRTRGRTRRPGGQDLLVGGRLGGRAPVHHQERGVGARSPPDGSRPRGRRRRCARSGTRPAVVEAVAAVEADRMAVVVEDMEQDPLRREQLLGPGDQRVQRLAHQTGRRRARRARRCRSPSSRPPRPRRRTRGGRRHGRGGRRPGTARGRRHPAGRRAASGACPRSTPGSGWGRRTARRAPAGEVDDQLLVVGVQLAHRQQRAAATAAGSTARAAAPASRWT